MLGAVLPAPHYLPGRLGNVGLDLEADAAGCKHHRTEVELDAVVNRICRAAERGLPVVVDVDLLRGRETVLATHVKLRRLAGNGGEARLGQGAHDTSLFHGVHIGADADIADRAGNLGGAGRIDRIAEVRGIGIADAARAVGDAAGEAELFQHLSADFSHRNLQGYLVLALDLQQVDDLRLLALFRIDGDVAAFLAARSGRVAGRRFNRPEGRPGEALRTRGVLRCSHSAGQHDVVGHDLDLDVGFRNEPPQIGLKACNVAFDLDV